MDADQWPLGVDVLKEQVKASQLIHDEQAGVERKASKGARARPEKEDALNCPRCNSTNTKFCYYNNYSLSQPRYFCKTCRRYWTEGGTTRNVPVGGGSRKNKPRSASICTLISSSSSSSPSSNSLLKRKLPLDPMTTFQNPRMILGVLEDLNQLGSNYNSSSNHHPQLKNEHHVYYNSTSCGPAGARGLIPMFFGEGKSVDEFDQSPPANLSSSICHFMPPAAAGNSSIGFSFVGSTVAGTNNIINANNINVDHHHQYFKLQSLHEGGHGLIINDHHHIGNYGNDVAAAAAAAAAARTIQQGVFHETTSRRLISHHPHEEEPFTTSVLLLQAAADHRYQGQNNKGQLGESSGYSWGGGVSGRGGLW